MRRLPAARFVGLVVLSIVVVPARSEAQNPDNPITKFLERMIPKRDTVADHTQHRAGHSDCVSRWAKRSECGPYSGSFVGGSCAFKGEGRYAHEGTWAWDYCGPLRSEHPWMKWCHGRRCQGGTGAYKTDGPHVPDPVAKLGI